MSSLKLQLVTLTVVALSATSVAGSPIVSAELENIAERTLKPLYSGIGSNRRLLPMGHGPVVHTKPLTGNHPISRLVPKTARRSIDSEELEQRMVTSSVLTGLHPPGGKLVPSTMGVQRRPTGLGRPRSNIILARDADLTSEDVLLARLVTLPGLSFRGGGPVRPLHLGHGPVVHPRIGTVMPLTKSNVKRDLTARAGGFAFGNHRTMGSLGHTNPPPFYNLKARSSEREHSLEARSVLHEPLGRLGPEPVRDREVSVGGGARVSATNRRDVDGVIAFLEARGWEMDKLE